MLTTIRSLPLAAGFFALLCHTPSYAGSLDQQSGWAAWFNTTKFSERWSLVSDAQLRSSDGWEEPRNLLLRAGGSYAISPQLSLVAGYAYIDTYSPTAPTLTEHRSWQQLVAQQRVLGYPLTHRLRLEQRFIERVGTKDLYSDRLRYFLRLVAPIEVAAPGGFVRGSYLALQNELFLHLTARSELNGRLFDQNRLYGGLGYRISPRLDVELGYLNQRLEGRVQDTDNHVVQFSLHTRLD